QRLGGQNHLRDIGRWAAPSTERRRRRRDRPAAAVYSRQRQALLPQPGKQYPLHHHGAGLRRQSQPGVHARSGQPRQEDQLLCNYKGRELMVTGSKECRVFLLDAKSIGGPDHRTALYRTPWLCNEEVNFAAAGIWGSMASWEDAKGTRWVLTPIWGPAHPDFKV